MKYLIVGLGNIGPEYHETRHNIGFMVLDALARVNNLSFTDGRYGFTTTLSVKGRQMILLKPSTFMNLSGNAVRYWMQKENIPLENVLIIVDDLALPFGTCQTEAFGDFSGCFQTFIHCFPVFVREMPQYKVYLSASWKIITDTKSQARIVLGAQDSCDVF